MINELIYTPTPPKTPETDEHGTPITTCQRCGTKTPTILTFQNHCITCYEHITQDNGHQKRKHIHYCGDNCPEHTNRYPKTPPIKKLQQIYTTEDEQEPTTQELIQKANECTKGN